LEVHVHLNDEASSKHMLLLTSNVLEGVRQKKTPLNGIRTSWFNEFTVLPPYPVLVKQSRRMDFSSNLHKYILFSLAYHLLCTMNSVSSGVVKSAWLSCVQRNSSLTKLSFFRSLSQLTRASVYADIVTVARLLAATV